MVPAVGIDHAPTIVTPNPTASFPTVSMSASASNPEPETPPMVSDRAAAHDRHR